MSTLVIFQLYHGVNKFYFQLKTPTRPLEIKHTCLYVKITFNMIDLMHKQCKICKKNIIQIVPFLKFSSYIYQFQL
jgi:hypothetical protein